MKRVLKIVLILISVVIVAAIGFVLTLQIFEYRPKAETPLEIQNNATNDVSHYVHLDSELKVLTWNTGYASLSATEDFVMDGGTKGRMDSKTGVETNMSGISQVLLDQAADIYLLQEVDTNSSRSYETNQYVYYRDQLNMSSALAYNYRCIFVPFPLNPSQMMGKVNSGIATYTNFYGSDALRIQLPGSFSWPLRLANLKRALLITRYPIAGSDKELVVINVHMSAYDDGSMRALETAALQQTMQDEYDLGNYVLVGGDFNQTLPGAYTKTSDSGSSSFTYTLTYPLSDPSLWTPNPLDDTWFNEHHFSFAVDATTPTCRLLNHPLDTTNDANNQYYVIDGFIVSQNITISTVSTLDETFTNSDHNPVVVTVQLNS